MLVFIRVTFQIYYHTWKMHLLQGGINEKNHKLLHEPNKTHSSQSRNLPILSETIYKNTPIHNQIGPQFIESLVITCILWYSPKTYLCCDGTWTVKRKKEVVHFIWSHLIFFSSYFKLLHHYLLHQRTLQCQNRFSSVMNKAHGIWTLFIIFSTSEF